MCSFITIREGDGQLEVYHEETESWVEAKTLYSNKSNVIKAISTADLTINAVKWFPGLTIISRDMLKYMKPNSLIVDIDAEPGGAIETSQYSTHENPVFVVDGIRHIGIPNLPSAVSNTSSTVLSC